MLQMFRLLFKSVSFYLLGFVLLVLSSSVILLSQVNSEANKNAIASAIEGKTGYRLTIGGDLSLNFFPALELTLSDVRLQNPLHPQELASMTRLVLGIEAIPLLNRRLSVKQIHAEGLHLNYFKDAEGHSIWESRAVSSGTLPDENINGDGNDASWRDNLSLALERVSVSNASVDIQNASTNGRYRLNHLNLDSSNTNWIGKPFLVELDFDYENNGMSAPTTAMLQGEVIADVETGRIDISELRASITPLLVSGEISISNLRQSLVYSGRLAAEPFDLLALLESLGMVKPQPLPPLTPGSAKDRQLSFDLRFNGDSEQANLSPVSLHFADSELEAEASLQLANELRSTAVSYTIKADNLDLSPLLPQTSNTDKTIVSLGTSQAPTFGQAMRYQSSLPIAIFQRITVLGSMEFESMRINEQILSDINIFTHLEDGVMDVEVLPLSTFEGTLQASLHLDTRSNVPELEVTASIADLNLALLSPLFSRFSNVNGFLQSESYYSASGVTAADLMASLRGNTAFSVTGSSLDIGLVKQVFTAIAALGPSGEAIQKWPDVIRFNNVSGYHLLQNGVATDQEMKLRMDNFDISGSGGIDLENDTFDYDMLFTVLGEPAIQTIPINALYHDLPWPVNCAAALNEEVNRYCRPEFTEVRQIFSDLGSDAVHSRQQQFISNQVPEELSETARELLHILLNPR